MNNKKVNIICCIIGLIIIIAIIFILVSNQKTEPNEKKETIQNKEIIIKLDQASFILGEKDTVKLQYTISDSNRYIIEWQSYDSSIATIDNNGIITALKSGTVTIVAKDNKGDTYNLDIDIFVKDAFKATTLSLENFYLTIAVGDTMALNYLTDGNPDKIKWSSSNPNILEVNEYGEITAKAPGNVQIYANIKESNLEASCTVKIIERAEIIHVSDIKLKYSNLNLKIGANGYLDYTISPSNAYNKNVIWKSSNPDVVSITEYGKLTINKNGSAVITVETVDGSKTASVKITAGTSTNSNELNKEPTSKVIIIKLNKTSLTMEKGNNEQLIADVSTNDRVTWYSSNESVAIVDNNGKVVAKSPGSATITAMAGGKSTKCIITVISNENNNTNPGKYNNEEVTPTGVTLNSLSETIYINGSTKTVSLVATVNPTNATNKTVTWTSSNTNVATVTSTGVVTAKSIGTAVITVKTANGKEAKCTITIVNQAINPTSISLNKTSATIYLNSSTKTTTLTTTVNPTNATNKTVTWTSSNTNVATVSSTGVVTAKSIGTAVITVKTANGKEAKCTITVANQTINPTGVSLNKTTGTIYLNNNTKTTTLTATVSPTNATNKTVTWTSSNTNVATVSSTGVVTAKTLGKATITAKTSNGKTATYTITVKKKIIIEIGASQSYRFAKYDVFTYSKGSNSYSYKESDPLNSSLVHIYCSGATMEWQYGVLASTNNSACTDWGKNGYNATVNVLNKYSGKTDYVEFYLYYLLIGNSISKYSCNDINTNAKSYTTFLAGYNGAIDKLKKLNGKNYNITAYVVSMHPVKPGSGTSDKVVSNTNENYCKAGYRSNWKYNLYNKKVKSSISSSYSNLHYVDTFNEIMDTTGSTSTNRKYTYKKTYTTESDGVHWDAATSKMYLKLMLDKSNASL